MLINEELRQPIGIPGEEDFSTLLSKRGEFKFRVFDDKRTRIGYLKFAKSSTYYHAQIQSSGDTFETLIDNRREYLKIKDGVAAGYFMSLAVNGWIIASDPWQARTFYFEEGCFWEEKTVQPLSCIGVPSIGLNIAAWRGAGFNGLHIDTEKVYTTRR